MGSTPSPHIHSPRGSVFPHLRVLPPALAVALLLLLGSGLYGSMSTVLLVTDPVWRSLVLERPSTEGMHLRLSQLTSLRRIRLMELGTDGGEGQLPPAELAEQVSMAARRRGAEAVVLSPGLSPLAGHLCGDTALPGLVGFTGPGTGGLPCGVAILPAPESALAEAGELTAELLAAGLRERSREAAGDAEIILLLPDGGETGLRYASLYEEGLRSGAYAGGIRVVDLGGAPGEGEITAFMREKGVGRADFAWVWGAAGSAEVLQTLGEWGIPACVTGPYAARAYPSAAVMEISYEWAEALDRALEEAVRRESPRQPGGVPPEVRMEARVRLLEGRHR